MSKYLSVFLLPLICGNILCTEECRPNIAIVGGGIGGASSAHFLSELFHNNLNIDLYEVKTIGGRLNTINIGKNEYESGGAIIHTRNKYMQDFVKILGLEHRPSGSEKIGIWNGNEFIFDENSWKMSILKLFYRYGIQPIKLYRYTNSILSDFENVYRLQDAGKSFENVTALFTAINENFPKLFRTSIKSNLLDLGYSEQLIDELVKLALVVNYGQGVNVHSFVGLVSVAGAGPDLWAVKGGNKKVPEHLIYRNKNVNVIPAYVRKVVNTVSENNTKLYELHYTNKDGSDILKSVYDIVILAKPLTHDQDFPIEFEGFPEDIYVAGKFHQTIATFVRGDLNPQYFGLDEELDGILSCDPNKTIISSVGRLQSVEGPVKEDNRVWKIFSNSPLEPALIKEMFSTVDEIHDIIWKVSPEYSTDVRLDKFKFHDGLYYINAIEWAASAMEMSAIGGRNVALLVHSDFCQKCGCLEDETIYQNESSKAPSDEL